MYSMMIIANNTVLYTLKILREILNVLITQKKWQLCDRMEVLANATSGNHFTICKCTKLMCYTP